MTKEELEKEAEEYAKENYCDEVRATARNAYLDCARLKEKRIADLEEAKANLEYLLEGRDNEIDELKKENKVLAQNLEDTEILNNTYEKRFDNLNKENAELKDDNKVMADNYSKMEQKFYDNLTKAKELLKDFVTLDKDMDWNLRLAYDAEQFLKEEADDKDHD